MKAVINENQRGLLFKNGRFVKYLTPGKYIRFGYSFKLITLPADSEFKAAGYSLEVFLKNPELKNDLEIIEVPNEAVALHFANGKFSEVLYAGKHAFFKADSQHEFTVISTKTPEVPEDLPRYLFTYFPKELFIKVEVAAYQKGQLYFDGEFIRLLEPGAHYFWNNGTNIVFDIIDARALQMDITGQEMLTIDKVALRINFVCNYRITDFIKISTEVAGYERQIHTLLQLALREYIGKHRLDEILENKGELSSAMLECLKAKEAEYFVSFSDAGVKDIILPGDIRAIMNTVLLAEKQAQANVITRREEVASTRSLLNTAKLMDENQTLYKLKELEYIEKICFNVGSISVTGGSDLLSQLTKIIKGEETKKAE